MNSDTALGSGAPPAPERRRWKLDPDEIPTELRDNWFIRGCMATTPEDEALLAELAKLDRLDP